MSRLLAEFIYRWRYLLSGIILVAAVACIPFAQVGHIDNDISAWFSRDDPVYQDYERFREEFGGTRALIIALQADSPGRLFTREMLSVIEQVSGDIERVDTVQRVASLATATVVDAVPDGIDVRPLLGHAPARDPEQIRQRATEDELIRDDLVSSDGTVTAIIVSFDEDRIDAVRAGVIQQIHDVVDPKLPEGVRAYYNGSLEISETYNRITLDNQRKLTPPILILTVSAIYFMFRSARKTAIAIVAIFVSLLLTLGLYAAFGFSFNVLSTMIIPLIVVLAIADDVHMMQHWDEVRRTCDVEETFKRTIRHLAAPLLGASATTALGMLSLATSNVVAVRTFGIGSAAGVMVDFVVSLVLVPTMLSLVKPETAEMPHERYLIGPLRRAAAWSTRHPRRVVAVSLIVGLAAAGGAFRLRVDTNHINFFSKRHPLNESAAVIDRQLAGVYSFQIMLEGPPESLRTPDALRRMDRLQERIRAFPYVRKVTSVADYVKRINRELNDGRAEAHVIPANADTIAQELFVFSLGGEGRHELERIVASDFSRAQISIKLQSMSSDLVLEQVEETDRIAKEMFQGTGISVLTTGSGRLFSTLDHYLVTSQVSSFGTAFVTVFAVIFLVFRSARFGLLAIVPNVLPVVAVFGVMGHLGISLNIATIMLASVALGVVDDDTVHFINRYRREVAHGRSSDEAIELATIHEGRAALTTAIVNSCGFGVLLFSEYKPNAWFGGLLALTMAVAFLAEIFILPAMITLLRRWFGADALRPPRLGTAAALSVALLVFASPASAQGWPTGHVSTFVDYLPNKSDTVELRTRAFAEEKFDALPNVRITLSGFVEGLIASREAGHVDDAVARVHDVNIELKAGRLDLVAGMARVPWGRLDELQPTDVINPLDVSRFFFDGRSEARLPVALVRGRLFLGEAVSLEGVYVPIFRRGRFDQLDEATSPFNVAVARGPVVLVGDEPDVRLGNAQGGGRLNVTSSRVDWSVQAYRGFQSVAFLQLRPSVPLPGQPPTVEQVYPRFTMIGGDFETVSGQWGLRGEFAATLDDSFQTPDAVVVPGSSFDAGVGVDRKAGEYRLSGTVLVHHESPDFDAFDVSERSDVSIIGSADRTFARERYQVRAFGVVTPTEESGFARVIATTKLRDNVAVEGSLGWFVGEGQDIVGRFAANDFFYLRVRYYF
jgi:predicted RND superfamily exporter protein